MPLKTGTNTTFWYFPPSNQFQVRVVRQKGEIWAFKSKELKVTMKKVHNTLPRRPERFVFTACSWNKCLKKAQGSGNCCGACCSHARAEPWFWSKGLGSKYEYIRCIFYFQISIGGRIWLFIERLRKKPLLFVHCGSFN